MKSYTILGFEQNSLQNRPVYLPKNKIWKEISWILLGLLGMGLFMIPFFQESEYEIIHRYLRYNYQEIIQSLDLMQLIGGCLGIVFLILIGYVIKKSSKML